MNSQSILVAAVAVLLVAAGGGAALTTGTGQTLDDQDEAPGPRDVDVDATFDNGTVTMTVTDDAGGVENVTVSVDDERVGTTGADGTVTFETNETDDLEVELEKGQFEGKLKYQIVDGSLVIVEEEYEYAELEDEEAVEDADDEDEDDDEETEEVEDETEDDETDTEEETETEEDTED